MDTIQIIGITVFLTWVVIAIILQIKIYSVKKKLNALINERKNIEKEIAEIEKDLKKYR